MERMQLAYLEHTAEQRPNFSTTIVYGIGLLYILYQAALYFDIPILSLRELLWNALVYFIPKYFLLDRERRQELERNGMLSQTHAAKSEALRNIVGLGGETLLQKLPGEGVIRRASMFSTARPNTDAPPGLGNWDNSCYQNSVLQGLASLDALKPYLVQDGQEDSQSTTGSLLETINKLNDPTNNGKQLWTPAKLKSMSSWQQQDAQEYFSKIVDALDTEAAKVRAASSVKAGLEAIDDEPKSESAAPIGSEEEATDLEKRGATTSDQKSPMDGLLAQRVACTRCGHSDGLSMIPFNCLTLPLGSNYAYSLEECLDEYTKLEEISDVECSKCTLLRAEQQLEQMLPSPPVIRSIESEPPLDSKLLKLPPELRAQAFKRLSSIQQALEDDDYTDKSLNETCQIPKKARVSSTKTRQAVVGRTPKCLVVHVNRSVFDEMTGVQRKNYASVQYPMTLDLAAWMLHEDTTAEQSLLSDADQQSKNSRYKLKAAVTHYGRHENGHYICYRQHPVQPKVEPETDEVDESPEDAEVPATSEPSTEMRWWRLSDEDVSSVSEEDVLRQGGVFMLFYELEGGVARSVGTEDRLAEVSQETEASAVGADDKAEIAVEPEPLAISSSSSEEPLDVAESITVPIPLAEETLSPSNTKPDPPSAGTTTEDESDADIDVGVPPTELIAASPPLMRTARGRQTSRSEKRFGENAFRAVAAT